MTQIYFKMILFTTITFSVIAYGYPQWEVQESGVTNSLMDVCFVDSLYGWAVGDSGTVIATTDGGNTWARQIDPEDTLDFRKVKFLNHLVGFVGGNRIFKNPPNAFIYNPIILKTTDGGATWVECDLGQNQELYFTDVGFSDIDKGWVAVNGKNEEQGGILLNTENGGNDWSIILDTKPYYFTSIAFYGNKYGYFFTGISFDNFDDSNVSFSEDGGLTWTQVGIIVGERIRNVSFQSADTLWAIGHYTWKSTDGGITWNKFHLDVTDNRSFIPTDIYLFDPNRIWLIGYAQIGYSNYSGVVISTDDSGENWLLELDIPQEGFNAFQIISQQHVWIVGRNGLIYYRNLKISTAIADNDKTPFTFELKQNYPNPFNSITNISFTLPKTSMVGLTIYDIAGKTIRNIEKGVLVAGRHKIIWYGKNNEGMDISSGIYFYSLESKNFIQTKKMILLK